MKYFMLLIIISFPFAFSHSVSTQSEIERTMRTCMVAGDFDPAQCTKNNTGYTIYEDCSFRNPRTGETGQLSDASCDRIYNID